MAYYIGVLKLGKFGPQKKTDNIEKESDERNRMGVGDDQDSDEIYQISKYDEERVTDDIEVLKLVKLSSNKNMDNAEK